MTIAWMLYVLLVGALLSVGAWGVEDALRYAKLPTRWVWAAAMLATVAFAAYALRGSTPTVSVIPQLTVKTSATSSTNAPSANDFRAAIEAARAFVTTSIAAATARVPANIVRWALIAWASASAVLLLMHVAVNRRVLRQRRTWPLATLPGGTVRVAPSLGPAVVGLASPEIVVPRWLLDKTDEEQRLVMVHEQEHIAARDQYLPVMGLLVATLLPWHPAVWWSLARLRLAVELDCDARVLRRGIHARPYGSLLIDIAGQCAGHRTGALALADRPSHLERRLRAMDMTKKRFAGLRAATVAAIGTLAIATACESRLPTTAEVNSMSAAGAQKLAMQAQLTDTSPSRQAIYELDGGRSTSARLEALPTDSIASIEITRSPVMKVVVTTKAQLARLGKQPGAGELHAVLDGTVMSAEATQRIMAKPQHQSVYSKRRDTLGVSTPTNTPSPSAFKTKGPAPVMVIDGRVATETQFAALTPSEISSVNVLKGVAAEQRYGVGLEKLPGAPAGAAASNGVILVTTKKGLSR